MTELKNHKLDPFFEQESPVRETLIALRELCLATGLTEEIKWRHPCYTHNGQNVCIFGNFREGARLSFFLGSMLSDPANLLAQVGPNTRAGKVVIFDSHESFLTNQNALVDLIAEAKTFAAQGIRFDYSQDRDDHEWPVELHAALAVDTELSEAWEALTPGRRRAWLIHFASAKQSQTVINRIDKASDKIKAGKGWNER